jgi:hypothetical protein
MNDGEEDSTNISSESLTTPPVTVQVIKEGLSSGQETLSQNETLTGIFIFKPFG